jgi:condensin-2 complex subunit H2
LATNWNIDIAQELEEYLSELESITISFDEGQTSLNFAEAALLIQGSACVYSKKVEYLYHMLYQTLEVLIEKRKNRIKSSVNEDGLDGDVTDLLQDDMPTLLPLDDLLIESDNIQMNENDIPKVNPLTRMMRAPTSLLSAGASEGEATKFKISDCIVHSSGTLLLSDNEHRLVNSNFKLTPSLPFGSPALFATKMSNNESLPLNSLPKSDEKHGLEAKYEVDDVGAVVGDNDFVEINNAVDASGEFGEDHILTVKHAAAEFSRSDRIRNTYFEPEEVDKMDAPLEDMWTVLDSYAPATQKVLKTGKAYVIPKKLSIKGKCVLSQFGVDGLGVQPITGPKPMSQAAANLFLKVPFFDEFSAIFIHELSQKKHRESKKKGRKFGRNQNMVATIGSSDGVEASIDVDDDNDDAAFAAIVEDALGDNQWDSDIGVGGANSGVGLSADGEVMASLSGFDNDASADLPEDLQMDDVPNDTYGTSYEDLCRDHVEQYLRGAERYLSETQLSKRVQLWQEKLEPMLEEEEKRPNFDVEQYGGRVIASVATISGNLKTPDNSCPSGEHIVSFSNLLGPSAPLYEVSRMFLSVLMLANQEKLQIHSEGVNDVGLELLQSRIVILHCCLVNEILLFVLCLQNFRGGGL